MDKKTLKRRIKQVLKKQKTGSTDPKEMRAKAIESAFEIKQLQGK